ncbi:MAG: hypothetical protein ABEJ67_03865 [Halanaeroarchaeum sp.]
MGQALTIGGSGSPSRFPRWVDRYRRFALMGLGAGTLLCLVAFLTNPVPDPSFPWATLPASLRVPITQPRIEHWPVTYTIGIWLWIFGFPALFLEGHRRFDAWGSTAWLAGLPVLSMVAWTTYCRFFWPKLSPPTWNAPAYTFTCWGYCATYDPFWSNLTYGIAMLGAVAVFLLSRTDHRGTYVLAAFGILALPLGLPAIIEALRRRGVRKTGDSSLTTA